MKMNTSSRFAFVATTAVATVIGVSAANSPGGIGAKYGARDPFVCKDKTQPKNGPISAAQAKKYFTASSEHVMAGHLYLVEDVTVQVGKPRPYNPNEDINMPNIDTHVPVYPIRGSFKKYSCDPIYLDRSNFKRNSSIYNEPNAKGACYKDSFGDWSCGMADVNTGETIADNAPPPDVAQTHTPANQKPAPKTNKSHTQEKPKGPAQHENGPPKPDFSAMAKWFDIVKYEYPEPPTREMYVYLKPKVENTPTEFQMEFRDKDGLLLQDKETSYFHLMPGTNDAAVGETVKVYVYTPTEKVLGQAATVKAVRVVK